MTPPEETAADETTVEENAAAAFAAAGEAPPAWADSVPPSGDALAERPEALVGAAFAGGVLAAMILKRLAR